MFFYAVLKKTAPNMWTVELPGFGREHCVCKSKAKAKKICAKWVVECIGEFIDLNQHIIKQPSLREMRKLGDELIRVTIPKELARNYLARFRAMCAEYVLSYDPKSSLFYCDSIFSVFKSRKPSGALVFARGKSITPGLALRNAIANYQELYLSRKWL
jgi:hypothetical protein